MNEHKRTNKSQVVFKTLPKCYFGLPPLPSTGSQQSQGTSPGPVAGPKFIEDVIVHPGPEGRARYKMNA